MIGQTNLLEKLNKTISSYPKFSIIVGPKGSGKKTIVNYIFERLNIPQVKFETSIEAVRDIIDLSYEQTEPICYVCPDADTMSLGAKNCLLKITEEPPNNAYFVLTLTSLNNTLETIQSRATVLNLDPYTKEELIQYRKLKNYSDSFDHIIQDICSCTGEVDELFSNDVPAFYKFAQTVAYQIHVPKTGNIFKVSKSVKSKTEENGFDAILLFKTVRNLFIQKAIETKKPQYLYASNVTSECLRDLQIPSLNTIATIDTWIMNVRIVLGGI